MRIPSGDLVPARRRRYDGGYGRRRRHRTRRLAVLGVLLLLAGLAGFWLSRDESKPAAAAKCVTPTASPAPPALVLPGPARVRVVLLNGTARDGLAKVVAAQLRVRGFLVLREDNAPAALAGPSQVTYSAGQQGAAVVLGRHVLGGRVSGAGPVPAGAVQVVLGGDFRRLATPAEVAVASRAPVATASPQVRSCP